MTEVNEAKLEMVAENGEPVLYLEHNGVRIAKRFPAERWQILVPGFEVTGTQPGDDPNVLEIKYNGDATYKGDLGEPDEVTRLKHSNRVQLSKNGKKLTYLSWAKFLEMKPDVPGLPPYWLYFCACSKCELEAKRNGGKPQMSGPFETRDEAEQHQADTMAELFAEDPVRMLSMLSEADRQRLKPGVKLKFQVAFMDEAVAA
jgi:hypothetical protein